MKIVLAALNAKYVHSNLAVYDLKEYANRRWTQENVGKDDVPEVAILEYTINHNLDLILQSLYREKAAVVAFSCYIWNIHEILLIAKELSKVAPMTKIWLGGPEVSYDSERILQDNPFVEGIIQGEGEATFFELQKCWVQKQEVSRYEDILGVCYRSETGQICKNAPRPLISLDEIPFIYQNLEQFENKILYYETSRGCPFSCSYCLSSIDKSVRFRSFELVQKELDFFLQNRVEQVKFIDRTFNCKRSHSLAIWNYLVEHDNGVTNFHFEVAADLIGEPELEVFEKMRPGLIQLEIGLQSTNPATIKEIRRVMDVNQLKDVMLTIRSFHNIHQHLDLIAGLPYEDYVTFKQSFNQAYSMRPNQLQLGFLKVLKGSYMGEQIAEYELQYQDSQPYEVLRTKWISYEEILSLKQVEEMVEVYHNSAQFEHVLAYLIPFFDSPFSFFKYLGSYYDVKQLYGIGFKRESRYVALRDFCKEWFLERENDGFSIRVLDDLLTYDFYLREKAKNRLGWIEQERIEKKQYQNFFINAGNEEFHFTQENYDSKVAARMMHIECVLVDTLKWILYEDVTQYEKILQRYGEIQENTCVYCLFDYENRNPLSKDAKVTFLTKL